VHVVVVVVYTNKYYPPVINTSILYTTVCQGDMFRPSRSSTDPSRTQIQALFGFPALWDPKSLQVSVTGVKSKKYISLYKLSLLCDRFTLKLET